MQHIHRRPEPVKEPPNLASTRDSYSQRRRLRKLTLGIPTEAGIVSSLKVATDGQNTEKEPRCFSVSRSFKSNGLHALLLTVTPSILDPYGSQYRKTLKLGPSRT